jgi:hypothetical protein
MAYLVAPLWFRWRGRPRANRLGASQHLLIVPSVRASMTEIGREDNRLCAVIAVLGLRDIRFGAADVGILRTTFR